MRKHQDGHKYVYRPDKQPKGRCYLCWEEYFSANIGKTAAWVAILQVHGFEYLEGAKGTRFVKMLVKFNEDLQKNAK